MYKYKDGWLLVVLMWVYIICFFEINKRCGLPGLEHTISGVHAQC